MDAARKARGEYWETARTCRSANSALIALPGLGFDVALCSHLHMTQHIKALHNIQVCRCLCDKWPTAIT